MSPTTKGILNFQSTSLIFAAGVTYDPDTNELLIPVDWIQHKATPDRPVGIYKDVLRRPAGEDVKTLYRNRRT
jgi:hypothetical protein